MKTWKLTINEDELNALINHYRYNSAWNIEVSARIHDLTKRLNKKDEPEITAETDHENNKSEVKEVASNLPAGW